MPHSPTMSPFSTFLPEGFGNEAEWAAQAPSDDGRLDPPPPLSAGGGDEEMRVPDKDDGAVDCSKKKLTKSKGKLCKQTPGCAYDKKAKTCAPAVTAPDQGGDAAAPNENDGSAVDCSKKKLTKGKGKLCKQTRGCAYDEKAKTCAPAATAAEPPDVCEELNLSKKKCKKFKQAFACVAAS